MEAGRQKNRQYLISTEEFREAADKHVEMEALMKVCRWSKLPANLLSDV